MNTPIEFDTHKVWFIAGWTMLHYLWLGTLIGILAIALRVLLRRAAANVRYLAALACLFVLAALPIAIAAWLTACVPRPLASAARPTPVPVNSAPIIELAELPAIPPETPSDAHTPPTATISLKSTTPVEPPKLVNPSPGTDRFAPAIVAIRSAVPYLPWLWLVGTPVTFALLAAGIVGTKRLRRASRALDDPRIGEILARLQESLRIGKRVTTAICDRIASPVLLGIVRPVILLPPAAITGWTPDEIEMVLLHELAHVRRWDNLVNFVQRLIESLLFFHPAVWLVSTWVRREREQCCDAFVVRRTERPHAYAELLVALASQMPRSVLFHPAASSAMSAGPLRSRIRRILQLEDDPMLISGKSLAVTLAGLLVAATLAVLYLPTIGQAEESATKAEESTAKDTKNTKQNAIKKQAESDSQPADVEKSQSLAEAVAEFNAKARSNPVGAKQPPLTTEEVIAAIRGWIREQTPVSDDVYQTYQKIAETQKLPPSASLKYQTGWRAYQGYDFDVWWIDLLITTGPRSGYGFRIRDTKLRSRPSSDNEDQLTVSEQADKTSYNTFRRFPSLEEQKLVDLVWKRLGLEMETIGDQDLKRVKALGYDGGLKVGSSFNSRGQATQFAVGDILVGLHVWPTTSMKDIGAILSREDLIELNPLKFYVIRQTVSQDPINPDPPDDVVTGRVTVNIDHLVRGGMQPAAVMAAMQAAGAPTATPPTNANTKSSQLFAADRILVAYDVPSELQHEIGVLAEVRQLESVWDERGRFLVQASRDQHAALQSILKETPKWRDPAAAKERMKQPLVMSKIDGEPVLEWRTAGLTFKRETRPVYLGRDPAGGAEVLKVAPGSPADWQSIRPGDSLTHLEQFRIGSLEELKSVLDSMFEGFSDISRTLRLNFVRNAKTSGSSSSHHATLPLRPDELAAQQAERNRIMRESDERVQGEPSRMITGSLQAAPTGAQPNANTKKVGDTSSNVPAESQALFTGKPDAVPAPNNGQPRRYNQFFYFFHTPDSAPSKELMPIAQKVADEFLAEFVPVDVAEQPDIATLYGVSRVPECIIVKDGKVARRLVGTQPVDELRKAMRAISIPISGVPAERTDAPTSAGTNPSALRYDGKSFDDWRSELQTELSTKKRQDAVNALAAFGRAGYAKEAADAILDVAGEYDFRKIENSGEDSIKNAVLIVLAPLGDTQSMAKHWVPNLAERLAKDPQKWQSLAIHLLSRLQTDDKDVIAIVRSLAETGPEPVRPAALGALVRSIRMQTRGPQLDDATQTLLTAALKSEDPAVARQALDSLYYQPAPGKKGYLIYHPELIALLFHSNTEVREGARNWVASIQDTDAPQVVESLVAVLKDESRKSDHIAAIRALGTIGPKAAAAQPQLEVLFDDESQEMPLRVAAAFAVDKIEDGGRLHNKLNSAVNNPTDEKAQTKLIQLMNAENQIYN